MSATYDLTLDQLQRRSVTPDHADCQALIAAICNEVVEFGAINAFIHKINEHIDIASIDHLHQVYLRVVELLLDTARDP